MSYVEKFARQRNTKLAANGVNAISRWPDCGHQAAARTLHDWCQHSQTGDLARAVFAPMATSQTFYGSPIDDERLLFLEALILGGDVAVVQSFQNRLAVMPEDSFLTLVEATVD